MTTSYEALKKEPQTGINRGDLQPEERVDLRVIEVHKPVYSPSTTPGKFRSVYYLEGDEEDAVRKFVEVNQDLLEQVDFTSNRNAIQSSVSRGIYDMILHELGERVLEKFDTVVVETRRDGTKWVIDRQVFESNPDRRYSQSGRSAKVPADLDLRELYDGYGNLISAKQLDSTAIEGDVRQILDYWRVSPDYSCDPTTTQDGGLAIRKRYQDNESRQDS